MILDENESNIGNIYLNVVISINNAYDKLNDHLDSMDTRVCYLMGFEMRLSVALPYPLWENKEYIKQAMKTPMPDDPYTMLPYNEFRAWMTVYELVMREAGLIGTREQRVIGLEE